MANLNSSNAIGGKVHLLTIVTKVATAKETARYVLTYEDTDGDYGDSFNADERAMLAAGHPVRRESYGESSVTRCMITATLIASRTEPTA